MKLTKRIVTVAVFLLLVCMTGTNIPYAAQGGCGAGHGCGAWCETVGECGHFVECVVTNDGVYCNCNGVNVFFGCDGTIDIIIS